MIFTPVWQVTQSNKSRECRLPLGLTFLAIAIAIYVHFDSPSIFSRIQITNLSQIASCLSSKRCSNNTTHNQNHSQEQGKDHPALVQTMKMSIVILTESIYTIIITHLPTGGVNSWYFGEAVLRREECSAALPHIGHVVLWAWVFYWTEAWHFLFGVWDWDDV